MNAALIAVIVIAPFFFLIMTLITLEAARRVGSGRGRRRKQTSGSVLESGVEALTVPDDSTGHAGFVARVSYTYQVAGREFRSQRWSPRVPVDASEAAARQRIHRYPPGALVRVYYNPDDPADAVLETGRRLAWLLLVGAAALILLGLLLVLVPSWLSPG